MIFFQLLGRVTPPAEIQSYGSTGGSGLFVLLGNLFRFALVIGAIYTIYQIINAGYLYISGDPKKIEAAWAKIYQSFIGLAIIVGSFTLLGIIGRILKVDLLHPIIYGP